MLASLSREWLCWRIPTRPTIDRSRRSFPSIRSSWQLVARIGTFHIGVTYLFRPGKKSILIDTAPVIVKIRQPLMGDRGRVKSVFSRSGFRVALRDLQVNRNCSRKRFMRLRVVENYQGLVCQSQGPHIVELRK